MEEALDLSFDRLLMMIYLFIYLFIYLLWTKLCITNLFQ